jgi:hypothetical protein
MRWRPFATFWQTAIDAANAMVTVPGEFRSYGHDYRADTAPVVRDAYALPHATSEQLARIEAALRVLEVERSRRIVASAQETPPPAPMHRPEVRDVVGGVPLRVHRTRGAAGPAFTSPRLRSDALPAPELARAGTSHEADRVDGGHGRGAESRL